MHLVLSKLFAAAKSPAVATCLVQTLNDALTRSIAARSEGMSLEEMGFLPSANLSAGRLAQFIKEVYDTHELLGVLGHCFDASQPGWNLVSRTRASALLRRALAWCTFLKLLISQSGADTAIFFADVSKFDADVSSWILQQLPELLAGTHQYRKTLIDLYCSVIIGDHSTDAKSLASANLATILEEILATSGDDIVSYDLPYTLLMKSFKPDSDIQQWNRHSTDAELRLMGCLLALRILSNEDGSSTDLKGELRQWVIKLRSALSEETVRLTLQPHRSKCKADGNSFRNSRLGMLQWLLCKASLKLFVNIRNSHEQIPPCLIFILFFMTCSMMTMKNCGTSPHQPHHGYFHTLQYRQTLLWLSVL